MAIIYDVNKGVDKSLEIKGINEKYIFVFLGYTLLSLFVFGIMRALDIPLFTCVLVCFAGVGASYAYASYMSKNYGQNGLVKRTAYRIRPRYIRMSNRETFLNL